jgi:hypothetical protein
LTALNLILRYKFSYAPATIPDFRGGNVREEEDEGGKEKGEAEKGLLRHCLEFTLVFTPAKWHTCVSLR